MVIILATALQDPASGHLPYTLGPVRGFKRCHRCLPRGGFSPRETHRVMRQVRVAIITYAQTVWFSSVLQRCSGYIGSPMTWLSAQASTSNHSQ